MTPRAIVAGAVAAKPGNAGGVWERLSCAEGLRRLGYDVTFLEEVSERPSAAAEAWFSTSMREFGIREAAMVARDGWALGGDRDGLRRSIGDASILINLSGNLTSPDLLEAAPQTAYVDVDPGYTQVWHADPSIPFTVPRHDHYFTIGENIGRPGCPIPTGGLLWKSTRQPVLLDRWPVSPPPRRRRFTTIASWRGPYGPLVHDGVTYGQKVHEFRRVIELPKQLDATFELALDIHDADARDRDALRSAGWGLVRPDEAVPTPNAFRDYVQGSDAEFSVAQGVYAHARTGWFSDRSTRYLASGRPVLVQETALAVIPIGEGIVTFRSLDEAVDGARRIIDNYQVHSRAARAIAESCFAAERVLARLLADVGLAPPNPVS